MGDDTSSTGAAWHELTARIAHPAGADLDLDGDLLQRHLLCQATGCHDERCSTCTADTGRGL